jgi:hypothetical protein
MALQHKGIHHYIHQERTAPLKVKLLSLTKFTLIVLIFLLPLYAPRSGASAYHGSAYGSGYGSSAYSARRLGSYSAYSGGYSSYSSSSSYTAYSSYSTYSAYAYGGGDDDKEQEYITPWILTILTSSLALAVTILEAITHNNTHTGHGHHEQQHNEGEQQHDHKHLPHVSPLSMEAQIELGKFKKGNHHLNGSNSSSGGGVQSTPELRRKSGFESASAYLEYLAETISIEYEFEDGDETVDISTISGTTL